MYWLNLLVCLLLGASLLALLLLTAADLMGWLSGRRWRGKEGPAVALASAGPGVSAAPAGGGPEPEEPPLAWILYLRGSEAAHRQALPAEGSTYVGRHAFAGLQRDVALRALEVAWRDGMPAVRSLDPTTPAELRAPGTEPVALQAGGGWEPWPEDAEIAIGGFVLRWREAEE